MRCGYWPVRFQHAGAQLIGDLLEVEAEDLDVLELDIVWPGVLAPHLLDLGSAQDLDAAGFFPAALASFKVGEDQVAVPWYLSVGRLLFRTDLLERYGLAVPTSWEEPRCRCPHHPGRRARSRQCRFLGFSLAGPGRRGADGQRAGMACQCWRTRVSRAGRCRVVDDPRGAIALGQAASWGGHDLARRGPGHGWRRQPGGVHRRQCGLPALLVQRAGAGRRRGQQGRR